MTRKDSEKDSERPHYYSQFWLDVAAGRHVIGAPKPEDGEVAEIEALEPAPQRRGRFSDNGDGLGEKIVHPAAEPARSSQQVVEPDTDDFGLAANDQEEEFGYQEDQVEDADVPDMDLASDEDEDEEFFEEDEEEEDDDMNWGRGRKKSKPTRAAKPAPKKPGKRDTRRPY